MIRESTSTYLRPAATFQYCTACVFCLAFCHGLHAKQLSVSELLDRYAANQDKLKSFVAKTGSYKDQSFFMENVRFEKIDGVWVSMEADYRIVSERQNSTRTVQKHYKIARIDIDPDHAELQSFVLDVQNGTRVKILEAPGIRYTWQNGEIVPAIDEYVIEAIDTMAEELMAEGQVPAGSEAIKKTEAAPNQPASIDETQVTTEETQGEILSESRSLPIVLIILISFLIIGLIAWMVFRRLKA